MIGAPSRQTSPEHPSPGQARGQATGGSSALATIARTRPSRPVFFNATKGRRPSMYDSIKFIFVISTSLLTLAALAPAEEPCVATNDHNTLTFERPDLKADGVPQDAEFTDDDKMPSSPTTTHKPGSWTRLLPMTRSPRHRPRAGRQRASKFTTTVSAQEDCTPSTRTAARRTSIPKSVTLAPTSRSAGRSASPRRSSPAAGPSASQACST